MMLLVLPPTKTDLTTLFLAKQGGTYMGGKKHDIATQLGLQQCCKTRCTFFVARFTVALVLFCVVSSVFKLLFSSRTMKILDHCFSVSSFILSRYGVFCN